ncbi:MAG: hypothetical protein Barrevirus14_12 [Barrevirus sp.]|uniref:Transmembrane protein n=1 Tax=Barrevirus sp. TaxID=2487763 RepID=A0A3G4ZU76_9VIRU|nr:MAG: hypothetical protein Barrevirus14_12 [Barrevirus sp.]
MTSFESKSFFDKSVFCLCCQSIWSKIGMSQILTTLTILTALVGCICNITVYSTPTLLSTQVETAGLLCHIISFGTSLFLTSYFGRYLSKLQHAQKADFKTYDCCCNYYYHSCICYILVGLYWFFTLVMYIVIAAQHDNGNNMVIINQLSKGIIMYFSSSLILFSWVVIFRPFIPNLCYAFKVDRPSCYLPLTIERTNEYNRYSWFINFFTNYGFYENKETEQYGIWSSVSLTFQLSMSIIVMNLSFSVYYNDRLYHDITIILSTGSVLFCLVIQSLISYASYLKNNSDGVKDTVWFSMFTYFLCCVGCWLGVSLIPFFLYMPYQGIWKIDKAYPETSMIRNIFYLVQGVPTLIIILVLLLVLIYQIGKCIKWCFCEQVANEISEAQNKVQGFQQLAEPESGITMA